MPCHAIAVAVATVTVTDTVRVTSHQSQSQYKVAVACTVSPMTTQSALESSERRVSALRAKRLVGSR